jgi:uncharacterized membrane protein YgcG
LGILANTLLFVIFGILILILFLSRRKKILIIKLITYLIGVIQFFIILTFIFIAYLEPIVLVSSILAVLFVTIFNIYIFLNIGKLTRKGADAKHYILGLKKFIKTVKKDEIKTLLKKDPNYLDKLLSYAILFGCNKHWLGFYSHFNYQQPDWHNGNMSNLSNTLSSISNNTSSSSSSNSGGSGGGGGGSW